MLRSITSLLLIVILHQDINAHPVHVSVMNVVIDTNQKEAAISFKFYKDDLSHALSHFAGYQIFIGDTLDVPGRDVLRSYIQKHVKMEHEHENIFRYDRMELEITHDICWVKLRLNVNGSLEKLLIRNTLLMDIYHDQTNLVIISQGGDEHGLLFNTVNREQEVLFDNTDNT